MSATGQCPKCSAANEYSKIVCDACGARLPWAEAVTTNSGASAFSARPPAVLASSGSGITLSPIGCLPLLGGFILALIFMGMVVQIFGVAAAWLIVVLSSVAVGVDASNLGVQQGQLKGFGDSSVAAWVGGCFLLWGVAFPAYLIARPAYVELAAKRARGETIPLHAEPRRFSFMILAFLAVLIAVIGLAAIGTLGALMRAGERTPSSSFVSPPVSEPALAPFFAAPKYSLSQYNSLQTGMSYSQVAATMGDPGSQMSHVEMSGITSDMYSWANGNGTSCNAQFQNDSLIAKGQFGLR